jgi:organic hydroperoxide reductase OsmC/OhrA
VDPEEAFVASIASCHMLTFLFLASRERIEVVSYEDHAVGTMSKNEAGVPWVSSVVLRPVVEYAPGAVPTAEQEERLHHRAHHDCFISNSVKTSIIVEATRRK